MGGSGFEHQGSIESAADRVTGELRRAILAGRLRPERELSLRPVARQLGVSFIPVREALRSLVAEGLMVIRPGRSAIPPPLEADELRAVCHLRLRIEPQLATRAANGVDEAHMDLLRSRLARCTDPRVSPDEQYEEFHAIYLDLLGCSAAAWELRVVHMLCRVVERYVRTGCGRMDYSTRLPTEYVAALRELIAVVRTRHPDNTRAKTEALVNHAAHVAYSCLPDTTSAR